MIVSAMKSLWSQWRTEDPGKWPPHWMDVTPGRISVVPEMNLRTLLVSSLCSLFPHPSQLVVSFSIYYRF